MKEMLVFIAKNLSEDEVVEKLQEHLDLYKEAKLLKQDVEKAKHHLLTYCQIYLLNSMDKTPMEIIKAMDQSEKANNLFQTGQN
jgi:hypothetical protein